jgi:hypothetical protein
MDIKNGIITDTFLGYDQTKMFTMGLVVSYGEQR